MTRRHFLAGTLSTVAFRNDTLELVERLLAKGEPAAGDEDFWMSIRESFALDPTVANFNNGGCCPSPRIVQDAFRRQLEYSNQAPSYYMWRHLEPEIEGIRNRLAKTFGCEPDELAITRNASEALEAVLFGLHLSPGDEVLATTQDYPRMIAALKQRERREGIKLNQIEVPAAPQSHKELIDAYERRLTPKTKLILVSQVVFMTGQIYPVREIVKLGEKHGIPVVVDGAHAFAQFPFTNKDLQCEFYGCSLHKWLMAPIGTGFLYIAKKRIPEVWSLMASNPEQVNDIRKFEEIGTHPAANHNAIGEALTFHEMIGVERKAARLRYLRKRWTDALGDHPKLAYHTNLNPEHSCGLTTVEIKGIDPGKLAGWLLDKHNVFVTTIGHPNFQGIRVTPNVYTILSEVDRFADAMKIALTKGIE